MDENQSPREEIGLGHRVVAAMAGTFWGAFIGVFAISIFVPPAHCDIPTIAGVTAAVGLVWSQVSVRPFFAMWPDALQTLVELLLSMH